MSDIPTSPLAFFGVYIPEQFKAHGSASTATSSGSMAISVPEVGEWSYRIESGKLVAEPKLRADAIVRITIPSPTFDAVVLPTAKSLEGQAHSAERQLLAFRALSLEPEQAKMIRSVEGTVAFLVVDGPVTHRLYVTPGAATPNLTRSECEIACEASAFFDLQSGKANPFELLMNGKLKISGNAQIPMALSALFA
jgi:SCP-2 sterol transfer family